MPIYRYRIKEGQKGCKYCREAFEVWQNVNDKPLKFCPKCGAGVRKVFSGFSLGASKTGLDRKAREKGFHKLKKVDKGKYEKQY